MRILSRAVSSALAAFLLAACSTTVVNDEVDSGSDDQEPLDAGAGACGLCLSNADCANGGVCLQIGGSDRCALLCSTRCTTGEVCRTLTTLEGKAVAACVPETGSCNGPGCGTCPAGETCNIGTGQCAGGGAADAGSSPDVGLPVDEPDAARDAADASANQADASSPRADAAVPRADAGGHPPDAGITSGSVKIIVEPSDKGAALLAAVQGAKSSIHMTMYILSWTELINALVSRHAAGVDVKVVLDSSSTTAPNNSGTYNTLHSAGVPVVWSSSSFTFTHEKCVIIDGKDAWIMTMNASSSSPTDNREYLADDSTPQDVADADAIFTADFAGSAFSSYQGALVLSPLNSQARLDALISTATKTLDIEDEELSDSNTVAAIGGRVGTGVAVRVVLSDDAPTAAGNTAISELKAAGVKMVTVHSPYIHAKAIVVDGKTAYIGSENLTYVSLAQNRELGVIFSGAAQVAAVESTIAADFAAGTAL